MPEVPFLGTLFRRGGAAPSAAAEPQVGISVRHELEAYTADGHVDVELLAPMGRLSDALNGSDTDPLAIRLLHTALGAVPAGQRWLAVEELLAVVAPYQQPDPRRHLHRPGRRVRMRVGPYEIHGNAHVPPGTQPSAFLGRLNPAFVPLTDAAIRRTDEQLAARRVPVLVVSLRRAGALRDLAPTDPR